MTEQEETAKNLVNFALTNKHRQKELCINFETFLAAVTIAIAEKKLITGFKRTAKLMYTQYISDLKVGNDDVQKLINYKTFEHCIKFYSIEYKIVLDAIKEYLVYLFSGRLLITLLGEQRDKSEMFNFITGEWIGDGLNE